MQVPFILFSLIAYLLGSISTATLYAKKVHNIDIKEHGSGNAGATNSLRVLGKKAGIIVLLIDVFKGFIVPFIASYYITEKWQLLAIGCAAVIGHVLPLFSKFKGGKGIATAFGVIIAVSPVAALICTLVFVVVVAITKYVSLASLLSAASFFVYILIGFPKQYLLIFISFALVLLLVITHRKNVERLLNGNENKISPKK